MWLLVTSKVGNKYMLMFFFILLMGLYGKSNRNPLSRDSCTFISSRWIIGVLLGYLSTASGRSDPEGTACPSYSSDVDISFFFVPALLLPIPHASLNSYLRLYGFFALFHFFVPAMLLPIHHTSLLTFVYTVSLPYFIFDVPMRKCLGKYSWMSDKFPI